MSISVKILESNKQIEGLINQSLSSPANNNKADDSAVDQ